MTGKEKLYAVFGVAGFLFLIWAGPIIYEHFGTRYASADREIFENSKPYIHGSIENLNRLKLEYELAETQAHKDAIRVMVVSQTTNLDMEQVPYHLRTWVESLR